MGFKNTGFPSPLFNPLGFRTSGSLLQDLIKNCGLISYNTPETDKVGKKSRDAVIAQDVVGDGVTHIDTKIVPNQTTALRVWGNFNSLTIPDGAQLMGSWNTNNNSMFMMGITSNLWRLHWGGVASNGGAADTNKHKFELKNGELYVDNLKETGTLGALIGTPTFEIFLNAFNNAGSAANKSNFNLEKAEIDHNGDTIVLIPEERQSDGITILKKYDASGNFIENIEGEQFLSPVIPMIDNNFRRSSFNGEGGTNADGSQYIDELLTNAYDIGTPITADKTGYLTAWIDDGFGVGIRPKADSLGPIQMEMVVCDIAGTPTGLPFESGGYIRSKEIYGKRNLADVNEILRNVDGTPKLIPYDDMANITYQQMFVSEDKQKILFFAEPIIRHSDCDSKARKFVKINEQLFVQIGTTGTYEPFLVNGEKFMVLKENASEVIE